MVVRACFERLIHSMDLKHSLDASLSSTEALSSWVAVEAFDFRTTGLGVAAFWLAMKLMIPYGSVIASCLGNCLSSVP